LPSREASSISAHLLRLATLPFYHYYTARNILWVISEDIPMAEKKDDTDTDNSGETTDTEDFLREIGLGEKGQWSGPPDDALRR
jgi:hypothetical protein